MFKISVLLNRRLSSYKLLYICPKNKERTNQFKTYSLHIDLLQPIRRPVFALWRRLWRSTGQARRPKPVSSEHQWTTSCSKVHKAIFCFQMWDDWVFKCKNKLSSIIFRKSVVVTADHFSVCELSEIIIRISTCYRKL